MSLNETIESIKVRYNLKMEFENLKHKHILEEIKAMAKAKVRDLKRDDD